MVPPGVLNTPSTAGSVVDGVPARISLGRPVEPPEVGAFQLGDTASGRGEASIDGSGTKSGGSEARPRARSGLTPATTLLSASSTISSSSRPGSFDDTGCGMAPMNQHAIVVSTNASLFGYATVTMSPSVTPRSSSVRAVRVASSTSSCHVRVRLPTTVRAGRSGVSSAKERKRAA